MRLSSAVFFLAIVLCVLVLGGLRLVVGGAPAPAIAGVDDAMKWSNCFGTRAHIEASTPIDVSTTKSDPTANVLTFRATGPVQADVADTQLENVTGSTAVLKEEITLAVGNTADQSFLFESDRQDLLVRHGDVSGLLTGRLFRFGPRDATTYQVKFSKGLHLALSGEAGQRKATMPTGTTGQLSLDTSQALTASEPLDAKPWLLAAGATFQPVAATAGSAINEFIISVKRQSPKSEASASGLLACVKKPNSQDRVALGSAIAPPAGSPQDTVSISVPGNLLAAFPYIVGTVEFALVSVNGDYAAIGSYTAIDHVWSGIISITFTAFMFIWLLNLRHGEMSTRHRETGAGELRWDAARWASGLFIGPGDGDPSLSLFQVFFWTVITVWGLAFVFVATGSLLPLTTQMMALLGIAGTGSVLARWIVARQGGSTSSSPSDPSPSGLDNFRFWEILSTKRQFDLLKLQIFVFTILIGAYVVWRIGDAGAFPNLDENTLLLLGVSQSVYIGGKLVGTPLAGQSQVMKAAVKLCNSATALENLKTQQTDLEKKTELGGILSADEQKALTDLPNLRTKQQAEIDKAQSELSEAVKALNLS